ADRCSTYALRRSTASFERCRRTQRFSKIDRTGRASGASPAEATSVLQTFVSQRQRLARAGDHLARSSDEIARLTRYPSYMLVPAFRARFELCKRFAEHGASSCHTGGSTTGLSATGAWGKLAVMTNRGPLSGRAPAKSAGGRVLFRRAVSGRRPSAG